jgi:hypothetical protein
MTYRNDLDAAHARIAALEAELGRTRRGVAPAPPAPMPMPAPVRPHRPARRVRYDAPRTYIPLLRALWTATRTVLANLPPLRFHSETPPASVLLWLAERAVTPIWLVLYPVFLAVMFAMVAYLGVVFAVVTPVVAIAIAMTRLRFTDSPVSEESGWEAGDPITEPDDAYMLVFGMGILIMACTLPFVLILALLPH